MACKSQKRLFLAGGGELRDLLLTRILDEAIYSQSRSHFSSMSLTSGARALGLILRYIVAQ